MHVRRLLDDGDLAGRDRPKRGQLVEGVGDGGPGALAMAVDRGLGYGIAQDVAVDLLRWGVDVVGSSSRGPCEASVGPHSGGVRRFGGDAGDEFGDVVSSGRRKVAAHCDGHDEFGCDAGGAFPARGWTKASRREHIAQELGLGPDSVINAC